MPSSGLSAAGVILAAGAGERMGGPKGSARLQGRSLLEWGIAALDAAKIDPIVVVTSDGSRDVRSVPSSATCLAVHNGTPQAGKTGSVQLGLRTLDGHRSDVEAIVVHPVDHPLVEPSTISELLRALAAEPSAVAAVPTLDGTRGHPLIIRSRTQDALLALDPSTPLNRWVRALGREVCCVPVSDPGVCGNLNTPAQLAAAERWLGDGRSGGIPWRTIDALGGSR